MDFGEPKLMDRNAVEATIIPPRYTLPYSMRYHFMLLNVKRICRKRRNQLNYYHFYDEVSLKKGYQTPTTLMYVYAYVCIYVYASLQSLLVT